MLREGRLTRAQTRALETLWPRYGCAPGALADGAHAPFARRAPVWLEVGTGNGDNLTAAAAARPDTDFLGCEVHRPGLGHALLSAERLALDNLRLLEADAVDVLAALPAATLAGVWIYFPDPWPKKRHHKRRLVQQPFLGDVHRAVARGGVLRFATDDADYAEAVLALVDEAPAWHNVAGPGCYAPRCAARILTRFERRARDAGRRVYDIAAVAV